MSQPILNAHLIGRFGNQLFQYCYARKFAEMNGCELRTNIWPGQKVFSSVTEGEMVAGADQLSENYRQRQNDLIYTLSDVRRYLKLHEWNASGIYSQKKWAVAHRRVGDFATTPGYPVISLKSYLGVADRLAFAMVVVSEETPSFDPRLPREHSWLSDFLRLVYAPFLVRGNSSFSWWAGTLNQIYSYGQICAPLIAGVPGSFADGKFEERDVEFVFGNHPRLADFEFTTDLNLNP